MERDPALQEFLVTARQAFHLYAPGAEAAQCMVENAFAALEKAGPATPEQLAQSEARFAEPSEAKTALESGQRLPVVDEWLAKASSIELPDPLLRQVIKNFLAIEPRIRWQRRAKLDMNTASANIFDSHANGMIFGPGGIEERQDVWLGLTLLAPHTRYPDHNHPPAEVYLNLSEGEFRQADGDWFAPGLGGSFYNTPFIIHAMRSKETPLFAFWLLYIPA